MSTDQQPALTGTIEKPKLHRGNYQVSSRVERALTLLSSGAVSTQQAACAEAKITTRALRNALRRPNVRQWMSEQIRETLHVGSMRAGRRIVELIESENAIASYRASAFALASGAGVVMPSEKSSVTVSVDVRAGFVIDLSDPAQTPTEAQRRVSSDAAHVTIEHDQLEPTTTAKPVGVFPCGAP